MAFSSRDQLMSTLVSVIHQNIGVDQNAFHSPNVLALKVTWLMKSVKLIKPKTVPIACAKLAAFRTVDRRFVHLVVKVYDVNHLNHAHADVSNVPKKQFCVQQAANVFKNQLGAMAFKIVLTTRKIV